MKVKCAVSGNTKATFLPKTSGGLNPLIFLGRPSTMKHVRDKIYNPLKYRRARRWKIICSDIHHVQRQRETASLECAGYLESCKKTKDGWQMLKAKCVSCGITKARFIPNDLEGAGILSSVADTELEGFLKKVVPILAKKSVEVGRYLASQAMQDPDLQQKVINYGMKKARPVIEKAGKELLDQLSTNVLPSIQLQDRPPRSRWCRHSHSFSVLWC